MQSQTRGPKDEKPAIRDKIFFGKLPIFRILEKYLPRTPEEGLASIEELPLLPVGDALFEVLELVKNVS